MVSCFISRLVILIFGTLYPAYASYKAVRTKNVKEYVKWMMYWIVFALFTCAETFTDLFLSFWFPFYYEIKIITVIYLLSPATKGSSILYRKFVHPVLIQREQEIDEYIAKAKEQGYYTMLNLGSKGVTYATSLIMQTAIKGGGGLVSQLKKSYSLGDLSEEKHLRNAKREAEDEVDSQYGDDPRILRQLPGHSPRRTISSASQAGLYFPEVDPSQRQYGQFYCQPSAEDMSSGYSSEDPFIYAPHLQRTASLGPTSRVRTRAATKNGLPKRASVSEAGSTWSALEPIESQIETESCYNFPLSQSASFPFPLASLNHLVRPEYQHLVQNQMFTLLNHPPFAQTLINSTQIETQEREPKSGAPGSPTVVISEVDANPGGYDPSATPENVEVKADTKEVSEKEENNEIDKPPGERSGRYNKKPAPTPPAEEPKSESSLVVEEEEEPEFCTPNASPLPVRKNNPEEKTVVSDSDTKDTDLLGVPKKTKPKSKKGEFNISKKLHMPKMSFPFWNQKAGKHPSGSETSLTAIDKPKTENKDDLEVYIPLRDADDDEVATKDETKADESQQSN